MAYVQKWILGYYCQNSMKTKSTLFSDLSFKDLQEKVEDLVKIKKKFFVIQHFYICE